MHDDIDLTNVDLATENLGEMWLDFTVRCTEATAIQFRDAYNLISITWPDNYLDVTISTILIDESMDTSDTIMTIRRYFIDTIVESLQTIGIIIDMDFVDPNSLKDLIYILNALYSLGGMEDILRLLDILDDETLDTKDRFITSISKLDPEYDTENFTSLIRDVAPNVTKGILVGLNVLGTDDTEYMEPTLKRRIQRNKAFLKGTLGEQHILNGGGSGLSLEGLTLVFMNDLGKLLVDGVIPYLRNVLSLMVIANLTDEQIESQFLASTEQFAEDMQVVYSAQNLLKEVSLHE